MYTLYYLSVLRCYILPSQWRTTLSGMHLTNHQVFICHQDGFLRARCGLRGLFVSSEEQLVVLDSCWSPTGNPSCLRAGIMYLPGISTERLSASELASYPERLCVPASESISESSSEDSTRGHSCPVSALIAVGTNGSWSSETDDWLDNLDFSIQGRLMKDKSRFLCRIRGFFLLPSS